MTDILYVIKGSAITLECPFHSVAIPVQWRGPTNLTVISDGSNIKGTLQNYNRLAITGQHRIGEYNLQVIDFNADDQGLYRCNSMVDGFAVQMDFILHLYSKNMCVYISLSIQSIQKMSLTYLRIVCMIIDVKQYTTGNILACDVDLSITGSVIFI